MLKVSDLLGFLSSLCPYSHEIFRKQGIILPQILKFHLETNVWTNFWNQL